MELRLKVGKARTQDRLRKLCHLQNRTRKEVWGGAADSNSPSALSSLQSNTPTLNRDPQAVHTLRGQSHTVKGQLYFPVMTHPLSDRTQPCNWGHYIRWQTPHPTNVILNFFFAFSFPLLLLRCLHSPSGWLSFSPAHKLALQVTQLTLGVG